MIFTICGSAKFESHWHEWNKRLGLMGHISYGLMTYPSIEGDKNWYTDEEKELLDLAHLAKIEESDAIFVLNLDGYIGESTRREIRWAEMRNKQIYYLEVFHYSESRGYKNLLSYGDIPGWANYYEKYGG
jgi:hypothetical protein